MKCFDDYIKQMKLLFTLVFRKADGTAYSPNDAKKKVMTLLKGGRDMHTLFDHMGIVLETDTFDQVVTKIKDKLAEHTNKVVQHNMLVSDFSQGNKSFEKWSLQVREAAKLINCDNCDWKQATVDAIILQTSSSKLRERALQENVTYDSLLKMGITKEQSVKGAALLEWATGQSSNNLEEEVCWLLIENETLRSKQKDSNSKQQKSEKSCYCYGGEKCKQGTKYPANRQWRNKYNGMNHFGRVC